MVRGRQARISLTAEASCVSPPVIPPSGQCRFTRQSAPITTRAASASASRSSGVPFDPSSPRVRSQSPTRNPAAVCTAIVPASPISMSSGCGPNASRSTLVMREELASVTNSKLPTPTPNAQPERPTLALDQEIGSWKLGVGRWELTRSERQLDPQLHLALVVPALRGERRRQRRRELTKYVGRHNPVHARDVLGVEQVLRFEEELHAL